MKKLILAAVAMAALTTACYAGGNDASFNSLKEAVKTAENAVWSTSGDYRKAAFTFNGKHVSAYYNAEDGELIGFSIHIDLAELPAGSVDNIQKKFNGWAITDKIMFTTSNGRTDYYVQVTKGKSSLALSVSPKGKAHIYAQMP
jgi:hypothetical protein